MPKVNKMASKGDFVLVEDPTLPMGWTKKVFAHFFVLHSLFVKRSSFAGVPDERSADAKVELVV